MNNQLGLYYSKNYQELQRVAFLFLDLGRYFDCFEFYLLFV